MLYEVITRVTLQQALALSLNTVAVRLILEVGPNAVMRTAHRLGIASKLTPNASLRITSYNVCYTKLLRGNQRFQQHVAGTEFEAGAAGCRMQTGHCQRPTGLDLAGNAGVIQRAVGCQSDTGRVRIALV